MGKATRKTEETRRSAVVVVLTVVIIVVLCGFAALTLDVGAMYNTRADLQRTADAAALAAAGRLADHDDKDPIGRARQAAIEYVERNTALGRTALKIDAEDIIFGVADYNAGANAYDFRATEDLPDAVRVRVRCTDDSVNGPMSLYFARIFGRATTNVSAEAVALMTPRDIAIVADLSGSINDDSELQSYKLTEVNLYDVWAGLPPKQGVSGTAGLDPAAPAAGAPGVMGVAGPGQPDGPAWGYMKAMGFGSDLDPSTYDPTTDTGLIRLTYNSTWSDANLTQYLVDRGYSNTEVTAILSPTYDSGGAYKYRTAVALGLAYWNSGYTGGLWEKRGVPAGASGNRNTQVDSGELEWAQPIFQNSVSTSQTIWLNYIDNYVRSSTTAMAKANSGFQYRFGIKTFVNYLLEKRGSHALTPELADVPTQPMQAIKDAAGFMTNMLIDLETNDQLSLEVYGTTARHEIDLTTDFKTVSDRLSQMQAGHYDGSTNMGAGIAKAIEELTGSRARGVSRKVIVLLTDGIANVDENGRSSTVGGGAFAVAQAQRAAQLGIKFFAVSVGAGADQNIMAKIADIGRGEHFHAEGAIDQYSADLARIFSVIGTKRSVELIE